MNDSGRHESGQRPVELHGQQQGILEALLDRNEQLGEMYLGALHVLDLGANPDRIAQCAHSLRELIEAIPDSVGVRIASLSDLSAEADKVESALEASRASAACYDGSWEGMIDDPLRGLVRAVEEFVAWRITNRSARIEVARQTIRELDPSRREVPGPLGTENIREWMDTRKYFTRVSHHGPVDESEFREQLARFEGFLAMLVRPRPFEDFDDLDQIIEEAEG